MAGYARNIELDGDGFSAMGGESGLVGAYTARQTRSNYDGVEDEHESTMGRQGTRLSGDTSGDTADRSTTTSVSFEQEV